MRVRRPRVGGAQLAMPAAGLRKPLLLTLLGLVPTVSVAASQPATPPDPVIEITGSRLRLSQQQIAGIGPVTVIDRDTIERSGATSMETLLQALPASAGFAGNQTNAYWVVNGYGTTQVNLRGLGINRTLVLLNGRRVANGGTGGNAAADLNNIPVGVVERIEVLRDGASAVYGADAVAGVVNIITRKSLSGAEASVQYGESTRSDGEEMSAALAVGQRNPASGWLLALSHSENRAAPMAERAPCPLAQSGNQLVCAGSANTIGGRAHYVSGPDTGAFINFRQSLAADPRSFEPYSNAKHGYNSNESLNAVNPASRLSLAAFGDVSLSAQTGLKAELMLTKRQSAQLATPGTLGLNRTIFLSATHPTNPTGQDLILDRRRLAEAGPRTFFQETLATRAVLALSGVWDDNWAWSLAATHDRNTGRDGSTDVANLDRVDATLHTGTCSSSAGAAVPCANYLGYGNIGDEVLQYIQTRVEDRGGNAQAALSAGLNGQLLSMPAGPLALAAGMEFRKTRGWRDPDPLIVQGKANTNAQQPVAGEYLARELYAELSFPLLADHSLAHALQLNTASRYSDYPLFGGKHTWKAGLDWQWAPAFKLRVNRSTGFRVPGVAELFGGTTTANLVTTDPCSGWSQLAADGVVAQNCRQSGVPAGFTQLGNTILTRGGGNAALKPENAATLTVGAVFTPSPSLTLTADYFRTRIGNAIQTVGGSTKLATCYRTQGLAHPFCGSDSFTRDATTGEINFLSAQAANVANEEMAGLDLGALYGFELAGLRSTLNLAVSRLSRYDVTPFPGAATIRYAGAIASGRGSYARWRSQLAYTFSRGAWSGTYGIQYIGTARDLNAAEGTLGSRVPAVQYHRLQLRFAAQRHGEWSLGIDNLFDRKAPFVRNWTDGNTDTMTYDLLGRRWHVHASYRW